MTTEDPKETPPTDAATARNKLIGRVVLLLFGALLLIYFVPLALSFVGSR